jgi:hypothetical protein
MLTRACSIFSFFGSKQATEESVEVAKGTVQAEINIFTVASGLLYEVRNASDNVEIASDFCS